MQIELKGSVYNRKQGKEEKIIQGMRTPENPHHMVSKVAKFDEIFHDS